MAALSAGGRKDTLYPAAHFFKPEEGVCVHARSNHNACSKVATEIRAYLFRIVLVVVVLEGIVTEVVLVGREHQYL